MQYNEKLDKQFDKLTELFDGKIKANETQIVDFIRFSNLEDFLPNKLNYRGRDLYEEYYKPMCQNALDVINLIFGYNLKNSRNRIKVSCGLFEDKIFDKNSIDCMQKDIYLFLHTVKVGDNFNSIIANGHFKRIFENISGETIIPGTSYSTNIINNAIVYYFLDLLSFINEFEDYSNITIINALNNLNELEGIKGKVILKKSNH